MALTLRKWIECTERSTGDLEDADNDGIPVNGVDTDECHSAEVSSVLQVNIKDTDDADDNAGATYSGAYGWAARDGFVQFEWFHEVLSYSGNNLIIEHDQVSALYDRGELRVFLVWNSRETLERDPKGIVRLLEIPATSTMWYVDHTGEYRINVRSVDLHVSNSSACPSQFQQGQLQFEGSSGKLLVFDYTCSAVTITYDGKPL